MAGTAESGAIFTECTKYRPLLWRIWEPNEHYMAFIGLNPSTADENKLDPTVTRCRNYAKSWGYGGFYMLNIFDYRSTDPFAMKALEVPNSDHNDRYILETCKKSKKVVCCWGNHGAHMDRGDAVRQMLDANQIDKYAFALNKSGAPKHPLYLRKTERDPFIWE